MMAKTKTATSERSVKECFIEVKGKSSFKTSIGTNHEDDGATASSAIDTTSSTAQISVSKTSCTRGEGLDIIDDSNSSEYLGIQNPGEKEADISDEDKSDYGAESFCSDDSCKGSEVTNVTPRSSLSGSSSLLLHSVGLKYEKRITDLMRSRRSGDQGRAEEEDENEEGLSFSESEMKYLSEEENSIMINRRQLTRSGRRNMSFTNEELRKIERENQLLLKKIMSHQKPQNKSVKPVSGAPRTSSSAINRRRQQKKIEEDNMILLRRIQQAKPCAMPRVSAPGCKLGMI